MQKYPGYGLEENREYEFYVQLSPQTIYSKQSIAMNKVLWNKLLSKILQLQKRYIFTFLNILTAFRKDEKWLQPNGNIK